MDVIASQRLGYRKSIDPSRWRQDQFTDPSVRLDDPQTHRWLVDDVLWYINADITRNSKSTNHCIVLRSDGLALIDTETGKTLWTFHDPDKIEWGFSPRGCPATFQPDRCTVIKDTNDDGSQEIVFSHPNKAELLCLDSSDGRILWRTYLFESAGIQVTAPKACPVVLQELPGRDAGRSSLGVVVASYDEQLANRWLINIDLADGKAQWHFGSQLMPKAGIPAALPNSVRPLHLHWGQLEKPPHLHDQSGYGGVYNFGYAVRFPTLWSNNPHETNLNLGTERPFHFISGSQDHWCWIDGEHLQIVDPKTGNLLKTWKLNDDCLCAPKVIRIPNGKFILLTVHRSSTGNTSDFVGWNLETAQEVWKQSIESDLNQLPPSFYSREQAFPVVVDLDGDGVDEWLSPSSIQGPANMTTLTPPFGSVMVHRGDNGEAIWANPFHLPNMDGMIEKAITVSDIDGDSWKDLLFGTRFQGGGVDQGVACFVDMVSGKTGERIWSSNVRTESTKLSNNRNEFVGVTAIEERGLIAAETRRGGQEIARPNSTAFLDLVTGKEQAFGLGLSARSFGKKTWLDHRIPESLSQGNASRRPLPGKLLGWDYPSSPMWSVDGVSPIFCDDLDHDGNNEVIGQYSERRESVLLNGTTGEIRWKKESAPDTFVYWASLKHDIDNDGIDDLISMISDTIDDDPLTQNPVVIALRKGNNRKGIVASIEIVSGSTGATIWQQSALEAGRANYIGEFDRGPGRLPLIAYQSNKSKKVTCIDLESRTIAWTSDAFAGEFWYWYRSPASTTFWKHADQLVWFSVIKDPKGEIANFVNAETGEILSQIPLEDPNAKGKNRQQVVMPARIRLGDRELFAIQATTKCDDPRDPTGATLEYKTDLWLVDKSSKLVDYWTETNSGVESPALKSWIQSSIYLNKPIVVRTQDNQERIGIVTKVQESLGVKLFALDESSHVTCDQTIAAPILSSSAYAYVSLVDRDRDGASDWVVSSDAGMDRLSLTGEAIWHRPALPKTHEVFFRWEAGNRKYLLAQSPTAKSIIVDEGTGEERDDWKGQPLSFLMNTESSANRSFITWDYPNSRVSALRLRNATQDKKSKSSGQAEIDPRYVRLLPWVVSAKGLFWEAGRDVLNYGWSRILKLALGVFLLPVVVIWNCMRRQFNVRHLIAISTVVAIALGLVIADKNQFPTDQNLNGYLGALSIAVATAVWCIVVTLPILELFRSRRRRILSTSLYGLFVVFLPLFFLICFPLGIIETTYTYREFWHLFWMALIPTGVVLILVHALWMMGRALHYLFRSIARPFAKRPLASDVGRML